MSKVKTEYQVPKQKQDPKTQTQDDDGESSSTVKRKKIDPTQDSDPLAPDDVDEKEKDKRDIMKTSKTRKGSVEKIRDSSSKLLISSTSAEVSNNGSGTLGRSRKKKAAPQPPAQQQKTAQRPSKVDFSKDGNDYSSSSSISKSSGRKISKKEKKNLSSSFAITTSGSEDCPFLAFKVKVG